MFTDLYRNTMWKNLSNRYLRSIFFLCFCVDLGIPLLTVGKAGAVRTSKREGWCGRCCLGLQAQLLGSVVRNDSFLRALTDSNNLVLRLSRRPTTPEIPSPGRGGAFVPILPKRK
jgi:hypothetical protein